MEQQKLELIDIYDISYHPWWLSNLFFVCLVGVLLCLMGYVLIVLYKKYRKRPSIPYWQKALNDLNLLKTSDCANGQKFYLSLTDILKQYLQERYQMQIVDKTDTELLHDLKEDINMPPLVYNTLKEILDGVVYIKFAHGQAVKERMEAAIAKSIELIQATHQVVDGTIKKVH